MILFFRYGSGSCFHFQSTTLLHSDDFLIHRDVRNTQFRLVKEFQFNTKITIKLLTFRKQGIANKKGKL